MDPLELALLCYFSFTAILGVCFVITEVIERHQGLKDKIYNPEVNLLDLFLYWFFGWPIMLALLWFERKGRNEKR